ncbi:MAG: hypothetical protein R2851_05595 [Caldilineaceae bacterium]
MRSTTRAPRRSICAAGSWPTWARTSTSSPPMWSSRRAHYVVLGRNADRSANGGVTLAYVYSGVSLANSDDEVLLLAPNGRKPTASSGVAHCRSVRVRRWNGSG